MPLARSLRGIEAKQARFGLVECINHGLLNAYPVTYEKEGDLVAHVRRQPATHTLMHTHTPSSPVLHAPRLRPTCWRLLCKPAGPRPCRSVARWGVGGPASPKAWRVQDALTVREYPAGGPLAGAPRPSLRVGPPALALHPTDQGHGAADAQRQRPHHLGAAAAAAERQERGG